MPVPVEIGLRMLAIDEIHKHSRGYPRQVIMLCHKALKNLVLKRKAVVDRELIQAFINEEIKSGWYQKDRLLQKNSY